MCEKDLAGLVDNKLNLSQQCDIVTNRANMILGCISRSMVSRLGTIIFCFSLPPLGILCPVLDTTD